MGRRRRAEGGARCAEDKDRTTAVTLPPEPNGALKVRTSPPWNRDIGAGGKQRRRQRPTAPCQVAARDEQ
ncbi:hypothetical protein GCM10010211_16440 [Streptomyces albospinus]|uniref:Uncharacterized protein n=1 Tax=Streptomyces albospinus TaxID=285515 RepID=A0ABQ2UTA2_9ACTN|nr:hypothetical protein GCM10010211_16440 [Streptomyces albospinus]